MPVNYYKTDLGIFSVVVGDSYYSGIGSIGSGLIVDAQGITQLGNQFSAVFPASAVAGIMFKGEDGGIDATRYNQLTSIIPRAALVSRPYVGQTAVSTDHALTEYSTKIVRTGEQNPYSDRTWWLNVTSRFRFNNINIGSTNSCVPYGNATSATSAGTTINYFKIGFLYANSDMSLFGYVELIAGSNNQNTVTLRHATFSAANSLLLQQFFDGVEPIVEEDDTDPYSDIDGEDEITGGGPVGIPGFPGLTSTSTGIIGLFAPSAAEMQALAAFMWTDFGGTGATELDVLNEIVEAIKRTISNPLDYVIGLNIIPSQGLSIGGSRAIRFGFVDSGVSMPALTNQYFTVDCGSLYFDTLCGDTFLDYAPYSKFSIYLPYVGVKDVDANDFVGHTIGVVYHGDTVTGGVTAYITKDGSVMYQYSGCCALNVPLSADSWGNTISGAVQIATSLVAGAATGGAAGVGLAAAKGAASVAANPSILSPQVSRSGAVSGGAGCMGVQYPFVIREAVRFHSTTGFNKVSGYPSFYYRSLDDVSGFTTVVDVHLENIPATQGEIVEIEKLLKEGVIL